MAFASRPRDMVVRFLSDVTDFVRGTDKVEDAFRDVARQMQTTEDKVETSTRDMGRAYERMADKIKRENRDAAKDTKQKLGEAGKEAGSEFAQNLGESISSGDISGLVSGTVGGLAGTFGAAGPIGLALAGLGAAATAIFTGMSTQAATAAAAAQTAFDNLMSGADTFTTTQSNLETAFGKGDYVANLGEAKRIAALLGMDWQDLIDLINEGNRGQAELKRIQDQYNTLVQKNVDSAGDLSVEDSKRARAAEDALNAIQRSSQALADGMKAQQDTATYMGQSADAAERMAEAHRKSALRLKTIADYYADIKESSYAIGNSTWQQQLGAAAPYVTGRKQGTS